MHKHLLLNLSAEQKKIFKKKEQRGKDKKTTERGLLASNLSSASVVINILAQLLSPLPLKGQIQDGFLAFAFSPE